MLTRDQINFLNRVCPNRWTEENGVVDVKGTITIQYTALTKIPIPFGYVNGSFDCDYNKLITLEGGPKEVSSYYSCSNNLLTNLIGAPEICNFDFWCDHNQLTSLEGCPSIIKGNLWCDYNPNLEYLWGIGRVELEVHYDNHNEINEWIITCARRNVIFPYFTLEENIQWIKREQKYSSLLGAPKEIRQLFSPRILQLVDSGVYNESKILDYKKFSRLC